ADAAAQVVHLDGHLCVVGRHVRQLRRSAGHRHHHSGGRLRPGMSAAARRSAVRNPHAPGEGEARADVGHVAAQRDGSRSQDRTLYPAAGDRRIVGAVRELRAPNPVRLVSGTWSVVIPGSAAPDAPAPATPRNLPNRGGPANPSAEALTARFAGAVQRVEVIWGETSVYVERLKLGEVVQWLHDDPSQRYDYLSDVTAVEYRDPEQPIEVV